MPRPAEIEVEEWAAPKGSYSLSARLVKPERPPPVRECADAIAASGENFVRIALVADIANEPVARRIEDAMDGEGQFDDAEAGTQMAAGDGDGFNRLASQLFGKLFHVAFGKRAQIGGHADLVQQGLG